MNTFKSAINNSVAGFVKSEFIQHAFCLNRYVWFHMIAGGLIAKIEPLYGMTFIEGVSLVALLAIFWEVLEFIFESKFSLENAAKTYGSVKYYAYDTIGDILGAVIIAMIVLM